jgi:hypothetical protein
MPLELPPNPGRPVSELRTQLEMHLDDILEARANRYTCEQIAVALGKKGIIVNGEKLRTYLTRIRNAKKKLENPPSQPKTQQLSATAPSPTPPQKPVFTMKKSILE